MTTISFFIHLKFITASTFNPVQKGFQFCYDLQVPTVNVVASGGGIRAMVATSGAIRALQEAGLLNWCTYMSTLSGSTW
jgi:hypothetical protein